LASNGALTISAPRLNLETEFQGTRLRTSRKHRKPGCQCQAARPDKCNTDPIDSEVWARALSRLPRFGKNPSPVQPCSSDGSMDPSVCWPLCRHTHMRTPLQLQAPRRRRRPPQARPRHCATCRAGRTELPRRAASFNFSHCQVARRAWTAPLLAITSCHRAAAPPSGRSASKEADGARARGAAKIAPTRTSGRRSTSAMLVQRAGRSS
jgi:hypothetical protein